MNHELADVQAGFRKAEEPDIKLLASVGLSEKQKTEKQITRKTVQFSSVAQLCPTICNTMDYSTPGFPLHHQLPVYSNSCPLSWWCHPAMSSSVILFSSCLQSFQHQHLFRWMKSGQSIGVSASTSVLPVNTQDWSPLGWTGWISCSLRDSQESSPAPPFKSINSLALSSLYSPTFTSINDYWKNHSFD